MRKPCQRVLSDLFRYHHFGSFFFFYYVGGRLLEVGNDGNKQFTEIGAPLVAFYWVSICVRWDFVLC